MSREPSIQTKLLASPPVFFGAWGMAIWSGYAWTQHPDAWPVAVGFGVLVAAVMKADEQVRAHAAWVREWNALAGIAPKRTNWPFLIGMVLGLVLLVLLADAYSQGGSQAALGVLLLFGAPIIALACVQSLWRWVRRGRAKRTARMQPVRVAVKRPLLPVPSLDAAYHSLPPYCQQLLRGQR